MRRAAVAFACVTLGTACGSAGGVRTAPVMGAGGAADPAEARARTAEFAQVEDEVIGWLAAADPRLAARAGVPGPMEVLRRIGTEAVLAEDATARIHEGSLDLFAFRARAHALDEAARRLAAFRAPLPDTGPLGSALARPRLERELLERVLAEERARAEEEAKLGDASGELVRGIVSTWTQPERPQDVQDRDAWVSRHLLEIRESLRDPAPRTGPPDLDVALYPLERLLAPPEFPRGSAAIAQVRMAIDADMRRVPRVEDAERLAAAIRVHLGVDVDVATLPGRLQKLEASLRERARSAVEAAGPDARRAVEARARELLLAEHPCPAVPDTRVRAMPPPPERACACGVLRALTEEPLPAAAVVALHDDVLLSLAALLPAPPPRTGLLSRPPDDQVDELLRRARERPVLVLGAALAADLVYGQERGADERLARWRALGEAPLDVVAREMAGP